MEIEIANWKKYHPRADLKSMPWVRIQSKIFYDTDFRRLAPHQKLVFFFLVTQAGFENSPTFTVDYEVFAFQTGVKQKDLTEAIEILIENGFITCADRDTNRSVREPTKSVPNVTKRNVTKRNYNAQIVSLYQRYPRKMGKQDGIKSLERQIKNDTDVQNLNKALDRFIAHHEKENTGKGFYPYFSTWANSWEEWLDTDIGDADTAGDKWEKEFLAGER